MSQAYCPSCGYTEQDAKIHMDHQLCNNAGRAPWEKHIGRGTITLTGEEYDAVKQRARDAIIKLICASFCNDCEDGFPVKLNSAGYYSHRENGNHCNAHRIYKAITSAALIERERTP